MSAGCLCGNQEKFTSLWASFWKRPRRDWEDTAEWFWVQVCRRLNNSSTGPPRFAFRNRYFLLVGFWSVFDLHPALSFYFWAVPFTPLHVAAVQERTTPICAVPGSVSCSDCNKSENKAQRTQGTSVAGGERYNTQDLYRIALVWSAHVSPYGDGNKHWHNCKYWPECSSLKHITESNSKWLTFLRHCCYSTNITWNSGNFIKYNCHHCLRKSQEVEDKDSKPIYYEPGNVLSCVVGFGCHIVVVGKVTTGSQLLCGLVKFSFQSATDLFVSLMLVALSLSVINGDETYSSGWLAHLECKLWNSQALLWGPFMSSTCNLICLTVER